MSKLQNEVETFGRWFAEFQAKNGREPDRLEAWDAALRQASELMECGHPRSCQIQHGWITSCLTETRWPDTHCLTCEAIARVLDDIEVAIENDELDETLERLRGAK